MKKALAWAWIYFTVAAVVFLVGLAVYQTWPVSGVFFGLLIGMGITIWAFHAVGLK
jgi:hypothetical protein